jgi:hypothetical protein
MRPSQENHRALWGEIRSCVADIANLSSLKRLETILNDLPPLVLKDQVIPYIQGSLRAFHHILRPLNPLQDIEWHGRKSQAVIRPTAVLRNAMEFHIHESPPHVPLQSYLELSPQIKHVHIILPSVQAMVQEKTIEDVFEFLESIPSLLTIHVVWDSTRENDIDSWQQLYEVSCLPSCYVRMDALIQKHAKTLRSMKFTAPPVPIDSICDLSSLKLDYLGIEMGHANRDHLLKIVDGSKDFIFRGSYDLDRLSGCLFYKYYRMEDALGSLFYQDIARIVHLKNFCIDEKTTLAHARILHNASEISLINCYPIDYEKLPYDANNFIERFQRGMHGYDFYSPWVDVPDLPGLKHLSIDISMGSLATGAFHSPALASVEALDLHFGEKSIPTPFNIDPSCLNPYFQILEHMLATPYMTKVKHLKIHMNAHGTYPLAKVLNDHVACDFIQNLDTLSLYKKHGNKLVLADFLKNELAHLYSHQGHLSPLFDRF